MSHSSNKIAITSVENWTGYEIGKAAKRHHDTFHHVVGFTLGQHGQQGQQGQQGQYGQQGQQGQYGQQGQQGQHGQQKSYDYETKQFNPEDSSSKPFEGFNVVVVVPPGNDEKVMITKKYLEACKRSNVQNVILVSVVMPSGNVNEREWPTLAEFKRIESMCESSGVKNCCTVRLGCYMENFILFKEHLRNGKLPLPLGNGRFAPICLQDAAEGIVCMAKQCVHGQKHFTEECTLTGNELCNGQQLAQHASKGLGKEIQYENIDHNRAQQIFQSHHQLDHSKMKLILELYNCASKNQLDKKTDHLNKLTGKNGTSVQEFFQQNRTKIMNQ